MKLKFVLLVAVLGSLTLAGWAIFEKHESEKTMLSLVYLRAVSDMTIEIKLLTSLREGHYDLAIDRLERVMSSNEAILSGCKNDLCAKEIPKEVVFALKAAEDYRKKYNSK